jgi:NitT/TauT family transport system ATP-binding protein
MAVIQATKISKTFYNPSESRAVKTLDDVSFSADKNEFVVLLGPSGCGKSTFLNILAGLTSHDRDGGTVTVHDRTVLAPQPDLIAYMFQDSILYPWRTVIKNVELGLETRGMSRTDRRERAFKYLDLVGLRAFADHYPRQISGGMAQRVALCRSLALETEIILMDEPFGALDEQTRATLGSELASICRELNLARPRVMGSPEFRDFVDELWLHLQGGKQDAPRGAGSATDRQASPLGAA